MSEKVLIDNETGEVSVPKPKFKNMWTNPYPMPSLDLSNEFEEVFEEVAPFAIDAETGKLLNPTSQPMIISKGKINVQERIQSYASQADIYSVLEKYAATGDSNLLNARSCSYGDISEYPNDLNGYAQYCRAHLSALDEMNPELAKMVIDKNVSAEDIENKANEILQSRIAANNEKKDIVKEVNK